ncbi:MAG: dihydrofolate reductase family protein [Pseudomonadota bacterium]|nr:dihydrofolate reductase family protein [Pseudomonadota bacterium]
MLGADLVDELRLLVYPVMLGKGKRLIDPDTEPTVFRLESSIASPTGIVISRYVREGQVSSGSFELG